MAKFLSKIIKSKKITKNINYQKDISQKNILVIKNYFYDKKLELFKKMFKN